MPTETLPAADESVWAGGALTTAEACALLRRSRRMFWSDAKAHGWPRRYRGKGALWPKRVLVAYLDALPSERPCAVAGGLPVPGARGGRAPGALNAATRERLEFLRANPGQWCRVDEWPADVSPSTASGSQRYYRRHPAFAGCAFAVRTVDGTRILFGRYTPGDAK